jgi:hypothetical protein
MKNLSLILILIKLKVKFFLFKPIFSYHFEDSFKENYSSNCIEKIVFKVSRVSLNQGMLTSSSKFLFTIWSLISFILISCFSGKIYSSMIERDLKTTNNVKETIELNVTIISNNYTTIHFMIKYNVPSPEIKLLKERIKFEDTKNVNFCA